MKKNNAVTSPLSKKSNYNGNGIISNVLLLKITPLLVRYQKK